MLRPRPDEGAGAPGLHGRVPLRLVVVTLPQLVLLVCSRSSRPGSIEAAGTVSARTVRTCVLPVFTAGFH